jgi:hypothetical protein
LREQQIGLVFQPANFQSPACDRAVLDLGAIVIRHELATADLAKYLPLVGQPDGILFESAHEQIGWTPIHRHGVGFGLDPRALDHGFIVAGDKTLIFPKPRDPQRPEILLEESFGVGVIRNPGRAGHIARFV